MRNIPHLPRPAPIEAFGRGGFRFAGMSHGGSLLCLPSGIYASPAPGPDDIGEDTLADIFAEAGAIEFFIIGGGKTPAVVPRDLRARFRAHGIALEAMSTATAVSTYNVLLGEGRRVGALLTAVE